MRCSASRLKTYMNCQMQAKFKYVDQLPTKQGSKATFGSIIHHCLQGMVYDRDLDKAIETFRKLWDDPELLQPGLTPEVWNRNNTHQGLKTRGAEVLRTAWDARSWDTMQVIGTEIPFVVPFGRHELNGFIDLLEARKSGTGKLLLRVADYKTSSYKPTQAELRHDVQFTIYEYVTKRPEFWIGNGTEKSPGVPNGERIYEKLLQVPRRCIWVHLWDYREIDAGSRDQGDYDRLYLALDQIERSIEQGIYQLDISGKTCNLCDFTEQCGITIPTPEELAAEPDAWL